jgi:chemotaxis protein MotB
VWGLAVGLVFFSVTPGCGYSQEEWDHKLRENEALNNQLKAQQQAHNKCSADYGAALQEVDDLKRKLVERGVNLDNLAQSLEEQKRALSEYRKRSEQLAEISKRYEQLRAKLGSLTELGLEVDVRDNRMLIRLPGDVLFASGKDGLSEEGARILGRVANVISSDQELAEREFQVAGHTDSKPLKGGAYKDNWGLSAMRARSVVTFLVKPKEEGGGGLNPARWSAAGYGATDPVANNATEEGRAANRRVEIVVVPNVEEMLNLNSLAR